MTTPESILSSRLEIERLIYGYGECLDSGDLEGVARLFAYGRMTGPDGTVLAEGYDGMLAFCRSTIRLYPESDTPQTQHVMSNLMIDIDEDRDTASGNCCYTVFQKTADSPLQAIITGRYHDTFERIDGSWRFRNRQTLPQLVGDLSRHLTRYT